MDKQEKVKINDKTAKTKHFLIAHCKHQIVRDYIDITPDKGCNIKYCRKCGTTF